MNKFLQNITSLVAIVLFLIMGACNNHPQAPQYYSKWRKSSKNNQTVL